MNLTPEARAAKNAYQKKWAAKNRQKTQRYIEQYWERLAHKQVTDKLTVTKSTATCQECGGKFNPKRSDARFCSTPCRVRFNRKHAEVWK